MRDKEREERMRETHEQHLDQLELRMKEFVGSMEAKMSDSAHRRTREKIAGRIERYLDWYDKKVQQVEDSFHERLLSKKNNAKFASK